MASKINTINDLHIERARVKLLLQEQEDKMDQHYKFLSNKLKPFTGIIDAFGAFSGNEEKGGSRSVWMGLVGTVLKVGLPIVINRYFHKPEASVPNTWWGNILQTLTSVIDKDLVRMVVERVTSPRNEEVVDEEEGHTA